MQVIQGYDTAVAIVPGEYTPLPPGGYVCRILNAAEDKAVSSGRRMLVVNFDIEEGEYKEYFKSQYANDSREQKKWGGVYRQPLDGDSLPFFKGLITVIERSNEGYKWDWHEENLKSKLLGCVFGREEYFNTTKGENAFSTKCVSIRSVDVIRNGIEPPKDKLMTNKTAQQPAAKWEPATDDDDLPF